VRLVGRLLTVGHLQFHSHSVHRQRPMSCLKTTLAIIIFGVLPAFAYGESCANGICCAEWKVEQFRSGKHWADIRKSSYELLETTVETSKKTDRQLCSYFHGTDCDVTYSSPMCAAAAPREAARGSRPVCPGYSGDIPLNARACRAGETPAIVDFYGKNLSCSWCY
jgi:hypothetical protein